MKIAIGNDHGAVDYKNSIQKMLEQQGYEVINCGTDADESCDYTDFGQAVGEKVAGKKADFGIVICGTGIGISMAANKVKGVRCSLCTNTTMARLTREHNDSNVLAMGQQIIGIELAKDIVNMYLNTPFSNGKRHVQRIQKLTAMEK